MEIILDEQTKPEVLSIKDTSSAESQKQQFPTPYNKAPPLREDFQKTLPPVLNLREKSTKEQSSWNQQHFNQNTMIGSVTQSLTNLPPSNQESVQP